MPTAAPPMTEYKAISLIGAGVKSAGTTGSIEGYLSLWNVIDAYGDEVKAGAYKATIPQFISRGSLLHEHDPTRVIGTITTAREDSKGLWIVASFHGDGESQRIRQVVTERIQRQKHCGLSIGYVAEEISFRKPTAGETLPPWADQVRELRRIQLFEGSIVMMPALSDAGVAGVKGDIMSVSARMASRGVRPVESESLDDIGRRLARHGLIELPTTPFQGPLAGGASIGQRIAAASELRELKAGRSRSASVRLELDAKALLVAPIGASQSAADQIYSGDVEPMFIDRLPVITTEAGVIDVPVSSFASGAGVVADGALKPEIATSYARSSVQTSVIAGFATLTSRVLNDAPALQRALDTDLRQALRDAAEQDIINDILAWPGVGVVANAGNTLAALASAITTVRLQSRRQATVGAVNPNVWAALMLATATSPTGTVGTLGPAGLIGSTLTILGVPILPSNALGVGLGLIGCAATAPFYVQRELEVSFGHVADQFARNLTTARAELVGAVAVARASAWARLSGLT